MEQFDSSVEESSKVLEQQQRNDEQQCQSCAAELTETSIRRRVGVANGTKWERKGKKKKKGKGQGGDTPSSCSHPPGIKSWIKHCVKGSVTVNSRCSSLAFVR